MRREMFIIRDAIVLTQKGSFRYPFAKQLFQP